MKLLKVIKSKLDNTQKFIFLTDDSLIIEMTYINKNDGKDIICVPSQTSCNMKCKFCHITDVSDKIINRNIRAKELLNGVVEIYQYLNLNNDKLLLVSYMGCGEPMLNYKQVIYSMLLIRYRFKNSRFAIATCLPRKSIDNFMIFTNRVEQFKLNVKVHLSLHFTDPIERSKWMPSAIGIGLAIEYANRYQKITKNKVEIHYALIKGLNDNEIDIETLIRWFKDKQGFNVKFLFYNKKDSINYKASSKNILKSIEEQFKLYNIPFEYYVPPGLDVGASCGQFLIDYYLKYNLKEKDKI